MSSNVNLNTLPIRSSCCLCEMPVFVFLNGNPAPESQEASQRTDVLKTFCEIAGLPEDETPDEFPFEAFPFCDSCSAKVVEVCRQHAVIKIATARVAEHMEEIEKVVVDAKLLKCELGESSQATGTISEKIFHDYLEKLRMKLKEKERELMAGFETTLQSVAANAAEGSDSVLLAGESSPTYSAGSTPGLSTCIQSQSSSRHQGTSQASTGPQTDAVQNHDDPSGDVVYDYSLASSRGFTRRFLQFPVVKPKPASSENEMRRAPPSGEEIRRLGKSSKRINDCKTDSEKKPCSSKRKRDTTDGAKPASKYYSKDLVCEICERPIKGHWSNLQAHLFSHKNDDERRVALAANEPGAKPRMLTQRIPSAKKKATAAKTEKTTTARVSFSGEEGCHPNPKHPVKDLDESVSPPNRVDSGSDSNQMGV